jgi:endonuclease/exonuclease/phosphatase family metal-dependent hydrolase
MRIISWNMAAGFGHDAVRHERAWRWLEDQAADVCLVQEVLVPTWAQQSWSSVVFWEKYAQPWGSAVLTRSPGYRRYAPGADQPLLEHLKGAACIAQPADDSLPWLVSIHSSASSYTPQQSALLPPLDDVPRCSPGGLWEIDLAIHELGPLLAGRSFVAGGDLNSALLFDATQGGESNRKLFDNISAAGFHDLQPADMPEQQTFFRDGSGPYQLDHVFGDPSTAGRVRSWQVAAHVAQGADSLSDHAAVIVDLD